MKRALLVTVLAAGTLGLSACAFQPLYGDAGQIAAVRGVTIVVEGQERVDQMLDEALNDRFGTPGGGRYRLVAETSTRTAGLGVGADDIANRSVLRLTVDFSLVETATGTPAMTESVQTEATFDIPREPYAAISARRDAEERVTQEAADRIALRVARHIHRGGQ
ncbi:LPS assembly lipoprotein LptE [Hyphobacterium sp. HN65]|uniref:LPS assembly lipoprotein LptE n=1 Tax=Hyphobacterium lacteum TaxID=3116575 RepID=A0ABU7LTM2_9PROT|nr:LPS assembly lipoprotein LptE [Hyphobacterium sp. HN65]MEE2526996.1 LPS assembly lipoprotein LptE [Hyphobacterium sp. HN65]